MANSDTRADTDAAEAQQVPEETTGEGTTDGNDPGGNGDEADLEALRKQAAQAEDYFNRLARLQADFENFRRRAQQERMDAVTYANQELVLKLLPVVDNLERAIKSAVEGGAATAWVEGVQMVLRQFLDVLGREGVEAIEAVGREFDPNLHHAVMQEPSEDHPENTVIEEFQRGYRLGDRVIRPSLVKVSQGG